MVHQANPLVVAIKNGVTAVETINTGSSGGQYYDSSSYSGSITSLLYQELVEPPEFNLIEISNAID